MLDFKAAIEDLKVNLKTRKRVFIAVIGSFFIFIALIGLLIPLIPTSLIAIPGFILLSLYSPTVYAFLKRKTQDYPKIQSRMDRIRNALINLIHPTRRPEK